MAPVRKQPCLLTVLLLSLFSGFVSSLYFPVAESDQTCFLEEIPEDTMIVGHFRMRDTLDIRIGVVVKDPDDKLVWSQLFGPEGKFYFTSSKPGVHQICLSPVSSRPTQSADDGDMKMLFLDIKLDKDTNNSTAVAADQRLTELQLRVRQLTDLVQQIRKEQDYQRMRHKYFNDVRHSTNMWIAWWPIARCLFMVAIFTCQTHSW